MAQTRKNVKDSAANKRKGTTKSSISSPRKKQKAERSKASSASRKESEPILYFRNVHEEYIFEKKFAERPLVRNRGIKIYDFRQFDFHTWLQEQGWMNFISVVEEIIYPQLVRQFYCNISKDFTTYVKGVEIALSPKLLSEILNLPYDDEMPTIEATKQETFMALCGDSVRGNAPGYLASKELLTLNMKIFHYVNVYSLFPRSGSFTDVTIHDALTLYAISRQLPYNIPFEIMHHMLRCRNRKNGALPYGMVITRILKHVGVDLSGEEKLKYKASDTIDISIMNRLGYVFDSHGGQWVKKHGNEKNDEGVEAVDGNESGNEDVDGNDGVDMQHEVHIDRVVNDQQQDQQDMESGEVQVGKQQNLPTREVEHSPIDERVTTQLTSQLHELKKELFSHISQCFTSLHKPEVQYENLGFSTHSHVPSVDVTPTTVIDTPTTVIQTPTTILNTSLTATPTIPLPTPMGTSVLGSAYRAHSIFSYGQQPRTSPSFADMPQGSTTHSTTPLYEPGNLLVYSQYIC